MMKKPKHIEEHIWQQHLNWMKVMQAGQLTYDPYVKPKTVKKP